MIPNPTSRLLLPAVPFAFGFNSLPVGGWNWKFWLSLTLVFWAGFANHAEILVATNSSWRWRPGTNEASTPSSLWRTVEFNDASWQNSPAPFYYGENFSGGTRISGMRSNYTSLFLRRTLVLNKPQEIGRLTLRALVDDGFIAWINNTEIGRYNMSAGNIPYNGTASTTIELTWTQIATNLTGKLLPGTNVLAVQVFNRPITSSDLVFDAELSAAVVDTAPPVVTAVDPPEGVVTRFSELGFTFNEPVMGITAADLLINDRPATRISGSGALYRFYFEEPAVGAVVISWHPDHQVTDLANNRFDAANLAWHYQFLDQTAPRVTLAIPPAGSTVRQFYQTEITFSETVTGVEAADLLINGTPAIQVTGSGKGPYLFQFDEPSPGNVRLSWAAEHGIQDLAAPPNPLMGEAWSLTLDPNALLSDIIINEFLAANVETNSPLELDEDGELQDWIEIYNRGSNAVSLAGWALTDDPAQPGQWTFPDLALAGGQYLLVYASAKDRKSTGVNAKLHTNFKLNPYGEYLALWNNESPRRAASAFTPQYPGQRNDHSYGLSAAGDWRYFRPATPGAANGVSTLTGVTPAPRVNVARGFLAQPFTLIVSCPLAEASLRYTLDGSPPTAATGMLFTGPLAITNTTIFRVAAFAPDRLPSIVQTHTYIFPGQVQGQPNNPPGFPAGPQVMSGYPSDYEMDPEIVTNHLYRGSFPAALLSLPTLSIAMKMDDLFGAASGIYTHPENTGPAWERACSAELILTNGESGFQVDCGIRMQGNASRVPMKTPKHPMRLLFKGAYGPAQLEYALFPDAPLQRFDSLVLRADFNNSWVHWDAAQRQRGQRIRDAWAKDTMLAMGAWAGRSRFFHLYLNGVYWGLYDFSERLDANFAASYLGGDEKDYDVVVSKPIEAIDGNLVAYNQMVGLGNFADLNQYLLLGQYLDLTQFIDYTLLNFYGANADWGANNNWNAIRRRAAGSGFYYLPWDGERILEGKNDNRVSSSDQPSGLHTKLLASPEYRLAFADRVQKHLFEDGALTPSATAVRYQKWGQIVDLAILAESARWGDYRRDVHSYSSGPYALYTHNDHWIKEYDRLINDYFPARTAVVLDQLRSAGLYPALAAPGFGQRGGRVPRGFAVTMNGPASIYYTTNATDPRQFGSGAVAPSAVPYDAGHPLRLSHNAVVKARCWDGAQWSALVEALFLVENLLPSVAISEIMYNPVGGEAYEFFELFNYGSAPIDLGAFYFEGVQYQFPPGVILAPGARFLLASDSSPSAFSHEFPNATVDGWFSGSLANGGERLALVDPQNRRVVSVCYDDQQGWPLAADGGGYSLEILDPTADPSDPLNWRASQQINGTPGNANSPNPLPAAIRLNEVLAAAADPLAPDWIELHNAGDHAVNLAGFSLSDSDNPRKYVFPGNPTATPDDPDWPACPIIQAGGYLVIGCDQATNNPGWHTGFALDREGEHLRLYDPGTNLIDAVSIGIQVPDYSLGRHGTNLQWHLNQPTPGTSNTLAQLSAPAGLVINEWMADPFPGQDDWLELYNQNTDHPVSLQNLFLGSSNQLVRLYSLSFIPPHGHLRLWADDQTGPDQVEFKLPASSGTIRLYDQTGALVDQVNYGLQVEGISQGRWPDAAVNVRSFPGSASPGASNYLRQYAGPFINEILARNHHAGTNAWGHTADWIELFNPLNADYDLSGLSLGVDQLHPDEFVFPPGTVMPALGYLLVWCDSAVPASTNANEILNTGRSLSAESGAVCLYASNGQPVDSISYGPQIPDRSIGRAADEWQLLSTPTPGAANAAPARLGSTSNLKINEWMSATEAGEDWLELYNPDPLPIALAGLRLADSPVMLNPDVCILAPLSFMGPQSWVVYSANDKANNDPASVSFKINAQGEALCLFNTNGSLIDAVYFGALPSGVSVGRFPDGQSNILSFARSPSPGRANGFTQPPLITEQPRSQEVNLGEAVTFRVTASGSLPMSFQWHHDSQPIAGATDALYSLPQAQRESAGAYHVILSNSVDTATSESVQLRVRSPLRFDLEGNSQSELLRLSLSGTTAMQVVLEGSTNLEDWIPLATNAAPKGLCTFEIHWKNDPEPARFYRAIQIP